MVGEVASHARLARAPLRGAAMSSGDDAARGRQRRHWPDAASASRAQAISLGFALDQHDLAPACSARRRRSRRRRRRRRDRRPCRRSAHRATRRAAPPRGRRDDGPPRAARPRPTAEEGVDGDGRRSGRVGGVRPSVAPIIPCPSAFPVRRRSRHPGGCCRASSTRSSGTSIRRGRMPSEPSMTLMFWSATKGVDAGVAQQRLDEGDQRRGRWSGRISSMASALPASPLRGSWSAHNALAWLAEAAPTIRQCADRLRRGDPPLRPLSGRTALPIVPAEHVRGACPRWALSFRSKKANGRRARASRRWSADARRRWSASTS